MQQRTATAALALALLAHSPVVAQEAPATVPHSEIEPGVLGLPIKSVDNQPIGIVTQAGIGDGEPVLIGEVERPLGLGPDLFAIPASMYVNKGDHVQLTITADQVREMLARNRGS
jgi:hypothetical protein